MWAVMTHDPCASLIAKLEFKIMFVSGKLSYLHDTQTPPMKHRDDYDAADYRSHAS